MPHAKPRVFLDTSAIKHAVDRRIVGRRFKKRVSWGAVEHEIELTRWMEHYPNDSLPRTFRKRLVLLPLIAHLAVRQRVELICHQEVTWELMGLPHTEDTRGRFYGAPITTVEDPLHYGRVIVDGRRDPDHYRLSFFESIADSRYLELQHATGATQAGVKRRNQLADAFFIWCAERAGATYFLTTDLKLVRGMQRQRRYRPAVQVVAPDDLVKRLAASGVIRLRDAGSFIWWALKTRGRGPSNHPLEALRQLSRRLNRIDGFE